MSNPGTPETGALSIDQAVAALDLPRKEPEAPQAAAEPAKTEEQPNSPAEPTAENAQGAETPAEGEAATEESAEAEGEQPEQAALEPPKFWDAEAKDRFRKFSREDQEYILKKEDERNQATARSLQESTERRKAAEAETLRLKTLADGLNALLPIAQRTFQDKWANVDWNAVVDQYGADQAFKLQKQMEAERGQVQQLESAKAQTDQINRQRFVQEQEALLPTLAPELSDPKQGKARREELGQFLLKAGVPTQDISGMTALQAALAYDAMRWRNGEATAKKLAEAPKPAAPKKQAPAKPTGTASQGSPQQQRIAALSRKKDLSIDEAVELYNLKGSQAA